MPPQHHVSTVQEFYDILKTSAAKSDNKLPVIVMLMSSDKYPCQMSGWNGEVAPYPFDKYAGMFAEKATFIQIDIGSSFDLNKQKERLKKLEEGGEGEGGDNSSSTENDLAKLLQMMYIEYQDVTCFRIFKVIGQQEDDKSEYDYYCKIPCSSSSGGDAGSDYECVGSLRNNEVGPMTMSDDEKLLKWIEKWCGRL